MRRTGAGHCDVGGARHRGIVSVLAMLFLVLFAVMAIGFYGNVVTSVQVAGNDRREKEAVFAAESALQFIQYKLGSMSYDSGTDGNPTMQAVFNDLTQKLVLDQTNTQNTKDATDGAKYAPTVANVAGNPALFSLPGTSAGPNNSTIHHWMGLGSGAGSAAVQLRMIGGEIYVVAIGKSAGLNPIYRALQYKLNKNTLGTPRTVTTTTNVTSTETVNSAWSAPNGTIVTYSPISASNGITITGDVMALPPTSQVPATVVGGARITGTLSYPDGYPNPTVNNGGSIAATSKVTSLPPVPTFDTSAFSTLVPATTQAPLGSGWQSNQKFSGVVLNSSSTIGSSNVFNNVRIKAGSTVTFGNNAVINGVVYIESPAKVTFGSCVMNGVIVSDNNSSVPYNSSTKNSVVTIANGAAVKGTSNIDMAKVAASEVSKINALKDMFKDAGGSRVNASMIMTPNFGLNFQGGMTVTGATAIVGSQFTIANGSAISLSGVMMNLGNSAFTVGGGMTINSSGLPTSWPGATVQTTQTVTTPVTTSTTVTTYSTSTTVRRSTYQEVPAAGYLN